MKNKKGFTLVEMLIVVVIIGILAVALIPRLLGAQSMARDTARNKNMVDIKNGLEVYYNDIGSYPGLQFVGNPYQYIGCADQLTGELQGILSDIPHDPQKNHKNYGKDAYSNGGRNGGTYCTGEFLYAPLSYNGQQGSWNGDPNNTYSTGGASYVVSANMENMKNNNLVIPTNNTDGDPYLWWEADQNFYSDLVCDNIKLVNNNNQLQANKYYNNGLVFANYDANSNMDQNSPLLNGIRNYTGGNTPICETKDINRAVKAYFSLH